MSNFKHSIYTANVDLGINIPWGRTPEKTDGTCIFAEVFIVEPGSSVRVQFRAPVLHKTTDTAMVAALFIDDQRYAVRTSAVNSPGAGYFTDLPLEYCYSPEDGLPHTYRIHVGPLSGTMALNGISGMAGFGSTMAATLTLEEK